MRCLRKGKRVGCSWIDRWCFSYCLAAQETTKHVMARAL